MDEKFRARYMKAPMPDAMLSKPLDVVDAEEILESRTVEEVGNHVAAVFPVDCPTHKRLLFALHQSFPEFESMGVRDIYLQLTCQIVNVREKHPEDLFHFLEFFAGEAAVTFGMLQAGFEAKSFDLVYNKVADVEHDVGSLAGFRYWVLSLCFTHPGSDQWHGIVCSSWVFMPSSRTKRKLHKHLPSGIWGDEDCPLVALGNDLAIKVAFMCHLGWLNKLHFIIEQPLSSLLGHFPCYARLFERTSVELTNTFLGNFGAPSQKPVKLWHTTPWVRKLRTGRPNEAEKFVSLVRRGPGGSVTGIKTEMKESQAYPVLFGQKAGQARRAELESPHKF